MCMKKGTVLNRTVPSILGYLVAWLCIYMLCLSIRGLVPFSLMCGTERHAVTWRMWVYLIPSALGWGCRIPDLQARSSLTQQRRKDCYYPCHCRLLLGLMERNLLLDFLVPKGEVILKNNHRNADIIVFLDFVLIKLHSFGVAVKDAGKDVHNNVHRF